MNANRHHHRRTLLAALAGAMLLAGVAHAAERPNGRPSATGAGAASIQQAEMRSNARRRVGSYQIAVADRNNADIRSYGRSAGPGSAPADRNNAGLPQAETGASYSTWDPFDTEVADRDHDWYPDAEILDASLRLLSDPFGYGYGDDETDEPKDDDKVEDGSDRPACDPMDRDADGDVDFDDFKLLSAAFGTDEGDLDGDGMVTGADLGLMLIRIATATASAD